MCIAAKASAIMGKTYLCRCHKDTLPQTKFITPALVALMPSNPLAIPLPLLHLLAFAGALALNPAALGATLPLTTCPRPRLATIIT